MLRRVVLTDDQQTAQCGSAGEFRRRDRLPAVVPISFSEQSMEVSGWDISDAEIVRCNLPFTNHLSPNLFVLSSRRVNPASVLSGGR